MKRIREKGKRNVRSGKRQGKRKGPAGIGPFCVGSVAF